MTAISTVTRHSAELVPPPIPAASTAGTVTQVPASHSTTVTLGKTDDHAAAYSPAQWAPTPLWERTATDAITSHMAANVQASKLGNRFDDLGAALLARFKTDGGDFSQSVIQLPAATSPDSVDDARFHAQAANEIGLAITTRSGATVTVTLASDKDRLAVKMSVTGGQLSDAERAAVAKLSGAFQKAIDGLAELPPRLDIGDVLQFDTKALSSIHLHASVELRNQTRQTIDVVADDKQRTVTATGSAGTIDVSVDVTDSAILGTDAQRQAALTRYLGQFDKAQRRGQGDADLMALFKNAFSELHGSLQAEAPPRQQPVFSAGDHGMVTGLADFSASVSEVAKSVNPLRSDEVDAFSYKVSQQTEVRGTGPLDRGIRQHQASSLDASFHRSLYPDTALMLAQSRYSQNYFYEQVRDTASTDMALAYANGELVTASLTQSADQWRRTQKYQTAHLEDDITTPSSRSRRTDVLALIEAAENADVFDRIDDDSQRDGILADMHEHAVIESDAARLAR